MKQGCFLFLNYFLEICLLKDSGIKELVLMNKLLKIEFKLLRHNKTSVAMKDLTIMILFSQTVTLVLFDVE